jgi:hypothetical protein
MFVVVVVVVEMHNDEYIHSSSAAVGRGTTCIYMYICGFFDFSFPKIRSVEYNRYTEQN